MSFGGPTRAIDVLRAIDAITSERNHPPTIREVAARLGLRSSSSAFYHVDALRSCGLTAPARGVRRGTLRLSPWGTATLQWELMVEGVVT